MSGALREKISLKVCRRNGSCLAPVSFATLLLKLELLVSHILLENFRKQQKRFFGRNSSPLSFFDSCFIWVFAFVSYFLWKSWKRQKLDRLRWAIQVWTEKCIFPHQKTLWSFWNGTNQQTNFYWEIILFETQYYVQFVNTILIDSTICVYTTLIKVFAWTDITFKTFMWMFKPLDSTTACRCWF